MNFDKDKIIEDILKMDTLNHKISEEDYYENFICYLKNSTNYYINNITISKKLIERFLKTVDLEKIYKIINHYNVYVTIVPFFLLYHIEDDIIFSKNFSVSESLEDTLSEEIKSNKMIFLYTVNMKVFRYCSTDIRDLTGFSYERRLIRDRKLKLEKLNVK